MARKKPAGITNGELSDTAKQIFEDAFKKDCYLMFSLAEAAIALVKKRRLEWERADFLFTSIRWNLRNELSKIEHLPDAEKTKLPDGRIVNETRLTQSIQFLEEGAVHYFQNEFVGFYEGTHIAEISRSCSANMRNCEKAELWFLYGAFERCKKETDVRIEEATTEYEAKKATGYFHQADEPDESDIPNKFTRKQVMALLDAFVPEFRNADNTTKAAFIVKLTPYKGEKNIAQEFSYLRCDDYDDLVNDWKDKFRKSGRGRKKKTT